MAIDKSLRSSYGWGGPGGKSPGTSAGPGPGGQGAVGQATQNPGRTTKSAPSKGPVTTAKAPPSILSKLGPKTDVHHHTDTIEDVIQQTILDKQYRDEKEKFEEDWDFENLKVKAPKTLTPRTKDIQQGVPHLEAPITKTVPHYYGGIGSKTTTGFGPKGTQTYSQAVEDSLNRGFFDSGIGKFIKTALPFAIPALLPTKLATPYSMFSKAKTISKYAKQIGLTKEDIMSSLVSKSNVKNLAKNIGKKSTTDTTDTRDDRFGQRDRQEQKIEAPKDVVTENVQRFTQPQLTELQKRQSILQGYADKGALNEKGQSTLMQFNQMLEQATASMAHGGFIDRPLMGRSRDI